MELHTYACLSTGHVTEEVAKALDLRVSSGTKWPDSDWRTWLVAERWSTYGWWVWVNLDEGFDLLPLCLQDCMRAASDQGARWIQFDCDVEAIEDIPVYEW